MLSGTLVHHSIGWWDVAVYDGSWEGCSDYRIGKQLVNTRVQACCIYKTVAAVRKLMDMLLQQCACAYA